MKLNQLLLLIPVYLGCHSTPSPVKNFKSKKETRISVVTKKLNDSIQFDKIVFVTDSNEAYLRPRPDSTAVALRSCNYGESFSIKKELTNGWLAVGSYRDDEILGYIKKSSVGPEKDIALTNDKIAEIYSESNDKANPPNSALELSLITLEQFQEQKKTAINYLIIDTSSVKKRNGITKVPLQKGFKVYKDDADSETDYEGQYPSLNKYLFGHFQYEAESGGYDFIDKATGASSGSFPEKPNLSADKKSVICIQTSEGEDNYATISVFKLANNSIHQYMVTSYKNWLPAQDHDQFWGSDGSFYFAVIPSIIYLDHYGMLHDRIPSYPDHDLWYIKATVR